jgi:hypothetical protein
MVRTDNSKFCGTGESKAQHLHFRARGHLAPLQNAPLMRGLAAVHALIRVRFGENGPSFDLVDPVLTIGRVSYWVATSNSVAADPDDSGSVVGQFVVVVAERAGLLCAATVEVGRVKVLHEDSLAMSYPHPAGSPQYRVDR